MSNKFVTQEPPDRPYLVSVDWPDRETVTSSESGMGSSPRAGRPDGVVWKKKTQWGKNRVYFYPERERERGELFSSKSAGRTEPGGNREGLAR